MPLLPFQPYHKHVSSQSIPNFCPEFCAEVLLFSSCFQGRERGMMHYPADHELAEAKLFHQRHWHAAPSLLFSVFRGGTSNLLLGSKDCNNTCATQENNTSKKSRKLIEKFMLVCWRGLYPTLSYQWQCNSQFQRPLGLITGFSISQFRKVPTWLFYNL